MRRRKKFWTESLPLSPSLCGSGATPRCLSWSLSCRPLGRCLSVSQQPEKSRNLCAAVVHVPVSTLRSTAAAPPCTIQKGWACAVIRSLQMTCKQIGYCIKRLLLVAASAASIGARLLCCADGEQLLTGKARTAGEQRVGVCFMDDIMEYSPIAGGQYVPQILPILLQFAQHKVRKDEACRMI